MYDATKPPPIGLSEGGVRVEHMYGGLGRDFLNVIVVLNDLGTDPAIVTQVTRVLRDRLLLAQRAHDGDDGVGIGGAVARVSEHGGLDVVDLGPDRNPTQAA